MKMRQDNYVKNQIGAIYVKNETELSWHIGPSAIYEKN